MGGDLIHLSQPRKGALVGCVCFSNIMSHIEGQMGGKCSIFSKC